MVNLLKGVLHPLLKISMFCALSQNYQHLCEKYYVFYNKLSKELKNGIEIIVGQADQISCCLDK